MVGSGLNGTGESFYEMYKCEIEYPFSDKILGIRGDELVNFNKVVPLSDMPYVNSMDVYVSLRGSLGRAQENLEAIKKDSILDIGYIVDTKLELRMRERAVKLLEEHLRIGFVSFRKGIPEFSTIRN